MLDLGNAVRNGAADKSDYSGLGSRMTKWDGNTMSATESTGEGAFAQNLANKLKINVFAPNNTSWAHPSGRFSVGVTSSANTGKMIKFIPIKK